jgi:hypothetical protein
MPSTGVSRRVCLLYTDVSEEHVASIPKDGIRHSHRRDNLKSYNV